jgi:hypothetical protein
MELKTVTLLELEQNPNLEKPRLGLRRPSHLSTNQEVVGIRHVDLRQHDVAVPKEAVPCDASASRCDASARKRRKLPPHSTLLWPPRSELHPSVDIVGETMPPEQIWGEKDAKAAGRAAGFWVRRVARETAQAVYPDFEAIDLREQVEWFVLRHKLSIMRAFHQRLKRNNVVAKMIDLYKASLFGERIAREAEQAIREAGEVRHADM